MTYYRTRIADSASSCPSGEPAFPLADPFRNIPGINHQIAPAIPHIPPKNFLRNAKYPCQSVSVHVGHLSRLFSMRLGGLSGGPPYPFSAAPIPKYSGINHQKPSAIPHISLKNFAKKREAALEFRGPG
jgi:hypothetical protein